MKTCTKCGQSKSLVEFSPDRRKNDGKQSWCHRCKTNAQNERYARDPEPARAYQRLPEVKQRRNELLRRRRLEDPEWRARMNQIAKNRHDRKARQGALTEEVGDRDGWVCYLCGHEVGRHGAHVDHIIPISRGGTHALSNLAITHGDCNRRKRDRSIDQLRWVHPGAAAVEQRARALLVTDVASPRRQRSASRLAWRTEEDATLRVMWVKDDPWPVLERVVGRSVHAMRHRARVLGLPQRYRGFKEFKRSTETAVIAGLEE